MYYLGADPGNSGAVALVDEAGRYAGHCSLSETPADVWAFIRGDAGRAEVAAALLEKVHTMPQNGARASFTFGASWGQVRAFLVAAGIRFEEPTPQAWMREMHCMTGGDKNVTKARAQELFPGVRVTHGNADALLLAELARRRALGVTA